MAYANIRTITREFQPTAVGSNETTAVFSVQAGERIVWASCLPITAAAAATTSTITLGDGSDVDGYITTTDYDPEAAALGVPIPGTGAYLANSGGKLYTVDDTIDAVYTANGATGARPKVRFLIALMKEWIV